jgi:hypothetical protein
VGAVTVFPHIASERPRFLHQQWVIDIGGALELAGIAGQARKKLPIINQVIFKTEECVFHHHPWRVSWIIPGDRTQAGTLATLQTVEGLGFLDNVL